MLLGLSLALVVWTLWWDAGLKAKGKRQEAKGKSEEETHSSEAELQSHGVGGKKKVKGKAKAARVDVKRGHVARGAQGA